MTKDIPKVEPTKMQWVKVCTMWSQGKYNSACVRVCVFCIYVHNEEALSEMKMGEKRRDRKVSEKKKKKAVAKSLQNV